MMRTKPCLNCRSQLHGFISVSCACVSFFCVTEWNDVQMLYFSSAGLIATPPEFDVSTVGSIDSSYLIKGDPIRFIPINDLERCQCAYDSEVETVGRNFDSTLAQSWNQFLDDE